MKRIFLWTMVRLIFLLGLFIPSAFSQRCWVNGEVAPIAVIRNSDGGPLFEDTPADIVLWSGVTINPMKLVSVELVDGINVTNLLEYVFTANSIVIKPGSLLKDYIDHNKIPEDKFSLFFSVNVDCVSGSSDVSVFFIDLLIKPVNNKRPGFSSPFMAIDNIKVPWNLDVQLNYDFPLTVVDEDHFEGELISVTVEDDSSNFHVTWGASGTVKLMSKKEIFDSTTVIIIAHDGDASHDAILLVSITVTDHANFCPPLFSQTYYHVTAKPTEDDAFLITAFDAEDTDWHPDVRVQYSSTNPNVTIDQEDKTISFKDSSVLPGPRDLPYLIEIKATEVTNPPNGIEKSSNVLVLLNYDDEQESVFQENLYSFVVDSAIEAGQIIGHVAVNGNPSITFNGGADTFFNMTDEYDIVMKNDITEEDIADNTRNHVHVTTLVVGNGSSGTRVAKEHSTVIFYFDN